jgi:hypothetical protein
MDHYQYLQAAPEANYPPALAAHRQPPLMNPSLKSKRGGNNPLIAPKAAEMFLPSLLDRSAKNQSELSLLKLPEI